jgi:hypothetical protein
MTEDEAHKINSLYKQIDVLTGENNALKENARTDTDLTPVLNRLTEIESTLKTLNALKSK